MPFEGIALGVVGFAGQVPTFLLSPVAGVLTDRWNRYRVMVVTQVVSMAQAAALWTKRSLSRVRRATSGA